MPRHSGFHFSMDSKLVCTLFVRRFGSSLLAEWELSCRRDLPSKHERDLIGDAQIPITGQSVPVGIQRQPVARFRSILPQGDGGFKSEVQMAS